MLVLDTNVLSELNKGPGADAQVVGWLRHLTERPATTAVSYAELLVGLALMAPGERRDRLDYLTRGIVAEMGARLPFDEGCAETYAAVIAARRVQGRPIDIPDAQIAAIALAHNATLATRNVKDFDGLGISLVNPWDPATPPQTD